MTNKEFEDLELNHIYLDFYHESIISLHTAFISKGCIVSKCGEYAIEESQQLMRDMGYTNQLDK